MVGVPAAPGCGWLPARPPCWSRACGSYHDQRS
jgi:hypothetical protein